MSEISPTRTAAHSCLQLCRDRLQVAHERTELGFAVVRAEDRGGVDRGDHDRSEALRPAADSRSFFSVGRGGTSGAAASSSRLC